MATAVIKKKTPRFVLFLIILLGFGIILSAVSFQVSILGPAIGAFIVGVSLLILIIYFLVRFFRKRRGVALVVGIILCLIVLVGLYYIFNILYFIYLATGLGHDNQAQVILKPMIVNVQNLGGKELCSDGDNGYTLDNTIPWYGADFVISNTSGLKNKVTKIFADQGYPLKVDTERINNLKDPTNQMSTGDRYDPQTDYLTWQKGDESVSVTISPLSHFLTTTDANADASHCADEYNSTIKSTGNDSYVIGVNATFTAVQR